ICCCCLFFFFFFSSRRRHTRCLSDWSSDVCSSDLEGVGVRVLWCRPEREVAGVRLLLGQGRRGRESRGDQGKRDSREHGWFSVRSEERRVGKECRSRWGCGYVRERNEGGG